MTAENKKLIFDTYQVDKCIKKTEDEAFYYGFHLHMQKEILIWERKNRELERFTEIEKMTCFPYIIDYRMDNEASYIIMNYVRGIFFEEYLKQKYVFAEEYLVKLGLNVCDILCEFGQKELLCTQLWEPTNIMLTSDFRICFLDRSSIIRKDRVFEAEKENIKSALIFLRSICLKRDTIFYKVVTKDYTNGKQLKKELLNIVKQTKEYKRICWRQRGCYMAAVLLFLGSIVPLKRNIQTYHESVLMQHGIEAMDNQEYEIAIVNFQDILDNNQSHMEARQNIAECYWQEGNREKAEESFRKNVDEFQDGKSKEQLRALLEEKALSAYMDNDYQEALTCYQELEKMNQTVKTEEMMLNVYVRINDFENAKKMIDILHTRENVDSELAARMDRVSEMIQQSEMVSPQYCEVADMIVAENWVGLREKFRASEYLELCEKYGGEIYCFYNGDEFVKIYKRGMVYLGQMEQDKRSGEGMLVLLGQNYDNIILFQGEWSDDLPNGFGEQRVILLSQSETDREIWMSIKGNYINGYSDGEMTLMTYEKTDFEMVPFRSVNYVSDMGYIEQVDGTSYGGMYVAGTFTNGEPFATHYGHIDSVAGLGLGDCYLNFDEENM